MRRSAHLTGTAPENEGIQNPPNASTVRERVRRSSRGETSRDARRSFDVNRDRAEPSRMLVGDLPRGHEERRDENLGMGIGGGTEEYMAGQGVAAEHGYAPPPPYYSHGSSYGHSGSERPEHPNYLAYPPYMPYPPYYPPYPPYGNVPTIPRLLRGSTK